MNIILILLQTLLAADSNLQLPSPENYQKLYCQYHIHTACENVPPEEPESESTGMIV